MLTLHLFNHKPHIWSNVWSNLHKLTARPQHTNSNRPPQKPPQKHKLKAQQKPSTPLEKTSHHKPLRKKNIKTPQKNTMNHWEPPTFPHLSMDSTAKAHCARCAAPGIPEGSAADPPALRQRPGLQPRPRRWVGKTMEKPMGFPPENPGI
jgi:hypothetical protein